MAAKTLKSVFTKERGQINKGSFIGEKIYQLSQIKEFKNFVEIGTWNGQGSTKCFMAALLFRSDDSCLYSLETNRYFYELATKYWKSIMSTLKGRSILRLVYGRIVEVDDLITLEEMMSDNRFVNSGQLRWRKEDVNNYRDSPNILPELPDIIDVLLLDGGEFSTYAEFQKLRKRTKVVLLDDTMSLKCEKIRNELIQDKEWQVIYDLPEERNGICIACKSEIFNFLSSKI